MTLEALYQYLTSILSVSLSLTSISPVSEQYLTSIFLTSILPLVSFLAASYLSSIFGRITALGRIHVMAFGHIMAVGRILRELAIRHNFLNTNCASPSIESCSIVSLHQTHDTVATSPLHSTPLQSIHSAPSAWHALGSLRLARQPKSRLGKGIAGGLTRLFKDTMPKEYCHCLLGMRGVFRKI